MERKDFCIQVSQTGYLIAYKGFVIGRGSALVMPINVTRVEFTGSDATNARLAQAKAADREVNWLLSGNGGCPLLKCHIEIIESDLSRRRL